MKKLLNYLLFPGVCIGLIVFQPSCKKEAICDCIQDTLLIAGIYQSDPDLGKDAVIESIIPDTNFGDSLLLSVFSWTNDGLFNMARSLLSFDLSAILPQTQIKKATLSLYWITYKTLTGHTGENAFSIYRIISQWDEHLVTWNNQPEYTLTNKVSVPESLAEDQSYIDLDVTNLVQDMIDNPTESHGFLLKLEEEFPYKLVILAPSDYTDSKKRPKLIIYYW